MKIKYRLNKKGFSLTETMFTVVIGGILLGMIMMLEVGVNNSMVVGVAMTDISGDARLVLERVVQDLRWATDVETSRTINATTYTTANDEVVFEIPSIDGSGDVIDSTYDYIVFALDDTDQTLLRKIIDADASSSRSDVNQVIAGNVNAFSLSSGGTGLGSVGSLGSVESVDISLTVSDTPASGKTVSETITSSVDLRNK